MRIEKQSLLILGKCNDLFIKCLKLDTEFIKNIYNTFSYFNYNINHSIPGVDNNNYPNKVMNFLENNKEFSNYDYCYTKKGTFDRITNLQEKIIKQVSEIRKCLF